MGEGIDDIIGRVGVGVSDLMDLVVDLFGDDGEGHVVFCFEDDDPFLGGVGEGVFDDKGDGDTFTIIVSFAGNEPVHERTIIGGFEHGGDEGMEECGCIVVVPGISLVDEF